MRDFLILIIIINRITYLNVDSILKGEGKYREGLYR